MSDEANPVRAALLSFALGYPEAALDHPWGEDVVKVRGRVFLFAGTESDEVGIGVKLPLSAALATAQDFASPMRYGLGQHGWVSVHFGRGESIPVDLLRDWIDESYRAVAPRRLSDGVPRPGARR